MKLSSSDLAVSVDAVIEARRSIRAFTGKPIDNDTILEILRVASRAPSGTNSQPWRAYVLKGASRVSLIEKMGAVHDEIARAPDKAVLFQDECAYYPDQWIEPYLGRRRQNGFELYSRLGITKDDKPRMYRQHMRNFMFFDAPVGIIFTIDRGLGRGSFVDYGMFLQSLMIAAKARGVDTCPQAAWNRYGSIVLPHVGAEPKEMLLCAVAMGYANVDAPENGLHTPREPPQNFTTFFD